MPTTTNELFKLVLKAANRHHAVGKEVVRMRVDTVKEDASLVRTFDTLNTENKQHYIQCLALNCILLAYSDSIEVLEDMLEEANAKMRRPYAGN